MYYVVINIYKRFDFGGFMKKITFCLFLIILISCTKTSVPGSQTEELIINGTFSQGGRAQYRFEFTDGSFNGRWGIQRISGTFTTKDNFMTIRFIFNDIDVEWTWTIVDENHLIDQDGDDWLKVEEQQSL